MRIKKSDGAQRSHSSDTRTKTPQSATHYRTDLAAFQKYARRVQAEAQDERFLNLVEGLSIVRVLPPWGASANGVPFRETMVHRINSDALSSLTGREKPERPRFVLVCRRAELDEECPVCEYVQDLMERGRSGGLKVARQLVPAVATYANAMVVSYRRRGETDMRRGDGSVRIWRMPVSVRNPLVGFLVGSDAEAGDEPIDFTDPEAGRNVIVTRQGTGFNTRYPTVKLGTRSVPLPALSILKKMHNLDAFVAEETLEYDAARDALNESCAMLFDGRGGQDGADEGAELDTVIDDNDGDDRSHRQRQPRDA